MIYRYIYIYKCVNIHVYFLGIFSCCHYTSWISCPFRWSSFHSHRRRNNGSVVELVGIDHPRRLTWNLRIHHWKRKIIQTTIFRFYVNLPGVCFYVHEFSVASYATMLQMQISFPLWKRCCATMVLLFKVACTKWNIWNPNVLKFCWFQNVSPT